MFKFGKIPSRAPLSFGVSGLLGEDCKIYYENFFGMQHLGRSSDLICSRLSEWGLNELKVRTLLLFSVFEAHRIHSEAVASQAMKDPITLECGMDEEKVVIGVLFRGRAESPIEGIVERLAAGKPQGGFEELLVQIHRTADLTLLRVEPGVQMEIVSFMGIPGKIELAPSTPSLVLQVHSKEIQDEKAPEAGEYIELGDVDYGSLIQSHKPGKLPPSSVGEVLVQQFNELEEAIRVRGRRRAEEETALVKGHGERQQDQVTQVHGEALAEDELVRVKGEGPQSLFLRRLLNKVWPFKKRVLQTVELPEGGEGDFPGPLPVQALSEDVEKGSLQKAVLMLQQELEKTKKDSGQNRSTRWMEEMMAELVAEKGRLNIKAKQLVQSVHQKEMEFKRTEALLKEELRKQEELVRHRTAALTRSKEELSQASGNMVKMKMAHSDSSEEIQFKQKYELTQKLLANVRTENQKLNDKMEELRSQLMNAQIGAKSKGAATQTELSGLKNKYERTAKAFEEMKAAHELLTANHKQTIARMNSVTEKEEKVATSGDAKRLEAAMRLVANNQKDMEKLRERIEEYQEGELRLKRELHLSQQELRGLKAKVGAANKAGGGGGKVA